MEIILKPCREWFKKTKWGIRFLSRRHRQKRFQMILKNLNKRNCYKLIFIIDIIIIRHFWNEIFGGIFHSTKNPESQTPGRDSGFFWGFFWEFLGLKNFKSPSLDRGSHLGILSLKKPNLHPRVNKKTR